MSPREAIKEASQARSDQTRTEGEATLDVSSLLKAGLRKGLLQGKLRSHWPALHGPESKFPLGQDRRNKAIDRSNPGRKDETEATRKRRRRLLPLRRQRLRSGHAVCSTGKGCRKSYDFRQPK